VAEHWTKPAVIDADGINTLAQHKDFLTKLSGKQIVLTPHWGEFCRLSGAEMAAMHRDCLEPLQEFADIHDLKVLLKSHTSIYYDKEHLLVNTTGNDGLATGGSGDILSGLIAAFLAQKITCPEAAGMAAYHLGRTAELLAEKQASMSITPTDILAHIFRYENTEECDEA